MILVITSVYICVECHLTWAMLHNVVLDSGTMSGKLLRLPLSVYDGVRYYLKILTTVKSQRGGCKSSGSQKGRKEKQRW